MSSGATLPLAGRGVLITRPAAQSPALEALLTAAGARPFVFPAIEIADVEDRTALTATIDALDTYDLAIFISPNAVEKGWQAVRARRSFPANLKFATIGRGSARALRRLGVSDVIAPANDADSESLLALPELQGVRGQRIVIFRGVGGRELLRDALVARGASVDYAECYRRIRPRADVSAIVRAWMAGEINAIVVTSSEGLRNLYDIVGPAGREYLETTPIFVPHPRIAATARELELSRVVVTAAGDEALTASVIDYFAAG